MNAQSRGCRLRHPLRNRGAPGANLTKDEERIAAFGAAAEDRHDFPRARMEAVIDTHFFVLIYGSMLPTPSCARARTWTISIAPVDASSP